MMPRSTASGSDLVPGALPLLYATSVCAGDQVATARCTAWHSVRGEFPLIYLPVPRQA